MSLDRKEKWNAEQEAAALEVATGIRTRGEKKEVKGQEESWLGVDDDHAKKRRMR